MNYKLNLKPSPIDERDYIAETIYPVSAGLPESVDLRNDLQPIRNQGPFGTCAAQTASCMKEWQEKNDVQFDDHMSPQFVYNHRDNQDGEGMFSRDVMKILNKKGIVPETTYPYETVTPFSPAILEEGLKYIIEGYARVNTIEGCKKALIKNGPCYIAFPVYNYGKRFWKPAQGDKMQGGHAVTVVGYNKEGFIIRNSWGTRWGNMGYTTMPYEDWGMQWEIWTTIDGNTGNPIDPDVHKRSFWEKLIDMIKSIFSIFSR